MWSIAEIVDFLRGSYCGSVAVHPHPFLPP